MTQHGRAIGKAKLCPACGQSFAPEVVNCPADGKLLIEADPLIGPLLDGIEIVEFIGQGGMSLVYKARHKVLERFVAIKVLKADYLSEVVNVQRFRREAQAASRLQHPNVNAIHSVGVSPIGQPYLVLEFLSGSNLATILQREKPLNFQRTIRLFEQISDGLAHAHERGVIHRDLKPSNIVIIEGAQGQEQVKIVDFGTAKFSLLGCDQQHLTQAGEVLGTLLYMSPEQKLGLQIDARSDIYAVGYMFFEALEKDGVVPESVRWIVEKATAESAKDRFQDITAFRDALVALNKPSFQKTSSANRLEQLQLGSKKGAAILPLALVAVAAMAVAVPLCMTEVDKARLHLVWKKTSGAPSKEVLNSADDLASKIIDSRGNFREAERVYMDDALPFLSQVDARTKARIYFGLGRAYCRMNNVQDACVVLEQINKLLDESNKNGLKDRDAVFSYRQKLQVEANTSEPILVSKLDKLLTVAAEFEKSGLPEEADVVYNKAADIAARASLYNDFQLKALQRYLKFCERNHRAEKVFAINERLLALLEKMNLVNDPRYALVRLTHGRLLLSDGQVREAFHVFQEVTNSLPVGHPMKPEAWIDTAGATNQLGRLDLSETFLMLAAGVDGSLSDSQYARLYCQLGAIRRKDGEFDAAVECYQRVYKKLGDKLFGMPECATFPDDIMFCLLQNKRVTEALLIGEKALQVGAHKKLGKEFGLWKVASRVGEAYKDRRQFEKAKKYLTFAYEGADTNAYRAAIACVIGENYKWHGEPVVAEQYFRKAIRLGAESSSPSYVLLTFRCELVEALIEQGRLAQAIAMMDEITKSLGKQIYDPSYYAGAFTQLRLYKATGKTKEFLRFGKQVLLRRDELFLEKTNESKQLRLKLAEMEKHVHK